MGLALETYPSSSVARRLFAHAKALAPFPLGRLDQTVVLVMCSYLIHRGGCGTDVFLNGYDRWPQKSKRRSGGYIRDGR